MVENKFCGIFVDHNSKEYSIKLLKSISNYKHPIDIHIINNFDGFDDYGEYESIKLQVHNIDNIGYFQSINYVLKKIEPTLFDYIFIGNNDIEFRNDIISIIENKNYKNSVYCISPDIINRSGIHQNPHVLKPYSFFKKLKLDIYYSSYHLAKILSMLFRKNIQKNNKPYEYSGEIHMGNGSFYILTNHFFSQAKILDTPPFLNGEEAFLSNQIKSNGGKTIYDPDLKIYHDESVSLAKVNNRKKFNWSKKSYKQHRRFL
ncbi:glycosyltransferase family 2 protein [Gracilimonas sediminicola]|uniref:Glycosyltransferase, GT2 family n=1 Tax=Gracilimonas sediminicola TaxID=2952158 RepID=A0A9X2L666_9BACT|nr:hypothetical protein [Gracilimonas sediminicola]MCP9292293.1 hypothetical protein [Gracilimonas sediminicola]